MHTKTNNLQLVDLALHAGQIILENGAETYRVEETIAFLCASKGLHNINCFCVPTGIFLSVVDHEGEKTFIRRSKNKRIDLEVIAMVNAFSREYTESSNLSIDEAMSKLEAIAKSPKFPKSVRLLFAGIAGGFFTMMFNGQWIDFTMAFITSLLTIFLLDSVNFRIRSFFIKHIAGGAFLAGFALFAHSLLGFYELNFQLDIVIIGSLMPLVPGVAFTNALRDTISGDFLSGVSKLSEALVIAIAIAIGVGSILNFTL
jgi:uncharacterized membrane protein YjjP (DUF1212 family)